MLTQKTFDLPAERTEWKNLGQPKTFVIWFCEKYGMRVKDCPMEVFDEACL